MNDAHAALAPFRDLPVDWELSPEMAVTLYLEWGNNDWHGPYPPVRSKSDVALYFVVDAWERPARVRLVRRNSEEAVDLAVVELPPELLAVFEAEYGDLKGVFEPLPAIKTWLKQALGQD